MALVEGLRALPALGGASGPRARACASAASRSGASSPASIAAATPQPGSPPCEQSRKRQSAAAATTSANASSTPAAEAIRGSRRPGVSISSAPSSSANSSRCVVAWRPRASDARTSSVRWRSSPSRRFTSVLLPTPDMPTRACVRPGRRRARSALTPQPSRAEITIASAPVAADTAAVSAIGSRARSPLVHTTRTSTPPARASARKRSSRRRLRSMSSEVVTRHRSTLAASASSRASSSARASSVRRGSTWRIASPPRRATQSPVAGNSAGPRAAASSAPAAGTRASMSSPRTA